MREECYGDFCSSLLTIEMNDLGNGNWKLRQTQTNSYRPQINFFRLLPELQFLSAFVCLWYYCWQLVIDTARFWWWIMWGKRIYFQNLNIVPYLNVLMSLLGKSLSDCQIALGFAVCFRAIERPGEAVGFVLSPTPSNLQGSFLKAIDRNGIVIFLHQVNIAFPSMW